MTAHGEPERLAWVALGSNEGDRLGNMKTALSGLEEIGKVVARSSIYATEPVGGPPGQDEYLNAVVVLETTLTPHAMLKALLDLEHRLGRVRDVRWGPRTMDLDLLAHGESNLDDPVATVPHPRLHHRPFVLVPLAEVSPGWAHPVTGKSVEELLAPLDASGVLVTDLRW